MTSLCYIRHAIIIIRCSLQLQTEPCWRSFCSLLKKMASLCRSEPIIAHIEFNGVLRQEIKEIVYDSDPLSQFCFTRMRIKPETVMSSYSSCDLRSGPGKIHFEGKKDRKCYIFAVSFM